MSSRSIGQVAQYKPLARCSIEELAVIQQTNPSGGMLFARNPNREEKDAARKKVLDLFTSMEWPGHLRMLTMPGLDWRFERKLLGKREGNWMQKAGPCRTQLTCAENDRYIFHAAITKMPGLNTKRALTKILTRASFAERTVSNKFIYRFHFANVDDLMHETDELWDAAWFDYTGPLTVARMAAIKRFYHNNIRSTLIVTSLKARWNKDTSTTISRAGGHSEWLRQHLDGEVLHDIEYFDTSPMAQFAVRKAAGAP